MPPMRSIRTLKVIVVECYYGGKAQSIKQKINTRSSTEAEIVAVDDLMNKIVWTKLFVEAQGYSVKENILFQDNKSAIQLENNGKMSS